MATPSASTTIKEHYESLREDPERRNDFDAEMSRYGVLDYFRYTMVRRDDYNLRKTPAAIMLIMKKYMGFQDAHFLDNTMPPVPQTQLV